MTNTFQTENQDLAASWEQYPREHLDTYLVTDAEDPRINAQSILTRALIADTLWSERFPNLIDDELRFGTVLTWLLEQLNSGVDPYELLDTIGEDNPDTAPKVVRETYRILQSNNCPVADYITSAVHEHNPDNPEQRLGENALNTFSDFWRLILQGRQVQSISILEPACGSANDYRFIHQFGLANFINYTGIDIAAKNIDNAKARFPDTNFHTQSIIDSRFDDEAFDYLFVHDLFEHLSLEALDHTLAEILRIVKHQAWLHFFNVDTSPDHTVKPIEKYHWNTLSLDKLCHTIEAQGAQIEVISIADLLKQKFDFDDHYNPGAYTLLVTKTP